MTGTALREELESFLGEYQSTLSAYDAERTAALWGTPGTIVSDEFVGALHSREEMARGLAQAHPIYQMLGLSRVDHTVLDLAELTESLMRARVRWHFYDGDDELLTDSDYEYVLRRDDDGWHTYVAVAIDEAAKLSRLAADKGLQLPGI
ncbi:nuclear transport factor 2 family protein [Nocardia sp. NBC_00416]|uniref:nuclear transport factor 2 family protein n=1 Tax=Nocardia sp. NBC_00416 TaxID=2975991 RepID=UPI002E1FC0FE